MQITVDELVNNPEKYLALVHDEDIFLTRDGDDIARLTGDVGHKRRAMKALEELQGIIPSDVDLDEIRAERLLKK